MNANEIPGPEKRVAVFVDAELEDIIPGFIEDWKQNIKSMRQALDRGDYETIRVISHKMKGTGGTCGFDGVTEMGGNIEAAAKHMNNEVLGKKLDRLASYLERVEVIYE